MPKFRQQVDAEIARRGFVSVMNDTKWRELQSAVRVQLRFAPPYQLKVVLNANPHPEQFNADVDYSGDWSDECLTPFYEIEWIRVRPRLLRSGSPPVTRGVDSVEAEFLGILSRHNIPHRVDSDSIWIFGYAASTYDLPQ